MALSAGTNWLTSTPVPTTSSNAELEHGGGWSGNDCGAPFETTITKRFLYGLSNPPGTQTNHGASTAVSGSYSSGVAGLLADTVYYARHRVDGDCGDAYGAVGSKKLNAQVAVMPAPGSSSVTATTATITSNTYTANVVASTYTVTLYYKKTTDPSYTSAGSGTANPLTANLTGLSSNTQYQFYAEIVRTTNNNTTLASSVGNFTTLAGEPEITTVAASSVATTTATLNSTLDINEGTGVTVYWKWGTDNPPTQNTTASQAASADGPFSVGITGLIASTTYYHKAYTAFSTPSGTPNSGSVLSFATPADPAIEAANEDHMHIYEYDGIYGADKTVYFTLQSPAATSSDRLVTTAPGSLFAAGDIKVSIDGGSFVNAANSVTQVVASNPLYSLVIDDTTEMIGENIIVQIVDQNGPAFRDALIHIRTKLKLGQVVVDASGLTNTSAVTATGVGSGHGISAVGGATGLDFDGVLGQHVMRFNTATAGGASSITLDASASSTNDYYNGALIMIVGGTGAGQGRTITDYVGSTLVATVNKSWATNPANGSVFVIIPGDDPWEIAPGAELSALPTYSSAYAKMLQFLFQRFVYKRTQTATTFTMKKDDGTTTFASGGVSDDGTTQTHNEVT